MTDTSAGFTTAEMLTAGRATFTMTGAGRRWTYQIKRVQNTNRPDVFFVSLLTGNDNENDYSYLGIYDPYGFTVRTTKASKFRDDAEPVRGIRWAVGLIGRGQEATIEAKGFEIKWACQCQRCGRTLTVPSSIDNRLGPECAQKM